MNIITNSYCIHSSMTTYLFLRKASYTVPRVHNNNYELLYYYIMYITHADTHTQPCADFTHTHLHAHTRTHMHTHTHMHRLHTGGTVEVLITIIKHTLKM